MSDDGETNAPASDQVTEQAVEEKVETEEKANTEEKKPDDKELSKEERELEQKMIKVITKMPDMVQPRFKTLHMFSDERSRINDLFEVEVKKLSAKMELRKRPILVQRDAILQGEFTSFEDMIPQYDEKMPELETIIAGIQRTDEEKEEEAEEEKKHEPVDVAYLKENVGVPDFWAKSIEGHPMLQQIITEKDSPIIKHVTMVKAEKVEEPSSMITVEVFFEKNEFFTNDCLKFTCRMDKEDQKTEEVIGQAINWKEGKDVTKKTIKKKQKNKKTKETRTITKKVADDSFFNVFESKKIPDDFKDDEDDEDSETERTMQGLDEANDAANDLYDMYTGEALEYYLGFGASMSELLGAMGQNPYGDEDDEDDDEDGEDDKKKKGGKGKGKKGGAGGAGGAGGPQKGPNGEECKQQ